MTGMKRSAIAALSLLAILLAACASATPAATNPVQPTAGPQTLTLENKLAIGTLKLEGTGDAITAQEAAQLLPLWQQVEQDNANRDTNASDYQAIYQKIEADMTTSQIQAIQNLSLTNADLRSEMTSLGIQGGQGLGTGAGPTLSPEQRATRAAQFQADGGTPFPRAQGTPNPNRTPGAGGFGGGMRNPNQIFAQPLIKLLQTRAGA
jgi:hypothetical protein